MCQNDIQIVFLFVFDILGFTVVVFFLMKNTFNKFPAVLKCMYCFADFLFRSNLMFVGLAKSLVSFNTLNIEIANYLV